MPLARILRALRWRQRQWTRESDRAFHDSIFETAIDDPFTFAYPGYVTIRRFADLAGERIAGASRVLDVGCGPGEITCELAARFPDSRFHGIDHSAVAIDKARAHAARRALSNITFEVGDAERAATAGACDLVVMFDSFHHLLDPRAFVERMQAVTSRFLLIEPGGTPLGSWRRSIDVDWIAGDLHAIRAHVEHVLGVPRAPVAAAAPAHDPSGEAVEHRYTLEDFRRFFAGFGLGVRGTTAGFDVYPPGPHARTALAEQTGRYTYELVTAVDEELLRTGRDLLAKHWVIHAERGRPGDGRTLPSVDPPQGWDGAAVRGPYDATYGRYEGPSELIAGGISSVSVEVRNESWRTWETAGATPVYLSYHWWSPSHAELERDGMRSPLARPLAPGERLSAALKLRAPATPGRYVLAIDLVEEGVAWFSDAGVPCLTIPVSVR